METKLSKAAFKRKLETGFGQSEEDFEQGVIWQRTELIEALKRLGILNHNVVRNVLSILEINPKEYEDKKQTS